MASSWPAITIVGCLVLAQAGSSALGQEPHERLGPPTAGASEPVAPVTRPVDEAGSSGGELFWISQGPAATASDCPCADSPCACSQGAPGTRASDPCATSHKIVFYANDFSYLDDPAYNGCCLGDRLKRMPVGRDCPWGTLDIGGQLRLRYHHEVGMGQDAVAGPQRFLDTEHDFLLTRLRLYNDWKASDWFRVYVEGIYADVAEDDLYVPRPIDRNHGDILNAFFDMGLTDELTLRLGRQELLYGAQRFLSPLDWSNTRRTFEGARLLYSSGNWAIDGFYTNFVPPDPFQFDEADYNQSVYGAWGTYGGYSDATVDLFYIGYDDETAALSLHTVGGRLNGETDDWLWELTAAGQTGDAAGLTDADHRAAMSTVGLGRTLGGGTWKPTAWIYYDYATGNPSPNVVGTDNAFNQLFPLAHRYLGFIDAVQRSNIESVNLLVTATPTRKTNLLLWYYIFESNGGAPVPSIGGTPPQSTSKNLGQELDILLTYTLSPRSNVLWGYSHFWRGNKILNPHDADFFYMQWELNF